MVTTRTQNSLIKYLLKDNISLYLKEDLLQQNDHVFVENGCKERRKGKKDTPYLLLSSFSNYFLFPFIAFVGSLEFGLNVQTEFWIRYSTYSCMISGLLLLFVKNEINRNPMFLY